MSTGTTLHKSRNRLLLAAGGIFVAAIAYRRYNKELGTRWVIFEALNDTLESWRRLAGCSKAVVDETSLYIEGKTAPEAYPPTLERLAALASSPQAVNAVSAVVQGALSRPDKPSILDRVLEVAVSERGQQLVGVSTTKAVHAFCTALQASQKSRSNGTDLVDTVLAWTASPVGQAATLRIVASFVSAGVSTYSQKTAGINVFDRILEALAKPQHIKSAQKLVSTFCSSGVNAVANNLRKQTVVSPSGARMALQPVQKNGATVHMGQENEHVETKEVEPADQAAGRGVLRGLVADEIVRACQSSEVRATCAAMARAGCSGAADSALIHLREVSTALLRPPPEWQRLLFTVLFTWLLLIPLWFLHSFSFAMVPALEQI